MRVLLLLNLASLLQSAPCVSLPVPQLLENPAALSKLTGPAKPLIETQQPGYALLWTDPARAFVLLLPQGESRSPVLVAFERTASAARCTVTPEPRLAISRLPAVERFGTSLFFDVYQLAAAEAPVERIVAIDVAGVRVGPRVVLFPREQDHPRTASFETGGAGTLRYLLTGMSGGTWDIWRDGWLVEPDVPASPGGTLTFEGAPGSYFARRR